MKYVFLGGAGEVGASCLLISVADRKILIDCGMRISSEDHFPPIPNFLLLRELAPKLDAIFISHAHADHVGALPILHQLLPRDLDLHDGCDARVGFHDAKQLCAFTK